MTDSESRLLFPLDEFYRRGDVALPSAQQVEGGVVPEPYRRLLVHDNDMTPTLEAFHGEQIHLRVLDRHEDGEALWRQVVLVLDESRRPVEFGAIVIHLRQFPEAARRAVLEGRQPLGTILREHGVKHWSRPLAYLCCTSDGVINNALALTEAQPLYGRRNVIRDMAGNELANIIEILPPTEEC